MQLAGAHVWIVGASEGIGRALAKELAARGAVLTVSARQQDRLDALVAEMGAGHHAVACDVSDTASMQNAYAALATPPAAVVFAAGIYTPMSTSTWNLDVALSTIDVNLCGMLRLLDAVLPSMVQRMEGNIVVVSSVAGYRGLPKSMAYGASKAALTNLVESLRIELEPANVRMQLVSPGFVKTRLTDQNDFTMPALITPERAAQHIADGMATDRYDIHFPPVFSWFMKLLRILPNPAYFTLARRL